MGLIIVFQIYGKVLSRSQNKFCGMAFDSSFIISRSFYKSVHQTPLILNPQDNSENEVVTEESMEIESDEETVEENTLDDTLGEEDEIDNGDDWFYASDSDENDSCDDDDDDEDNIRFCSRNYVR